MSSEVSQRLNLAIAVLGALFCLSSLLNLHDERKFATEIDFQIMVETLIRQSPSLMASFFVVLIPAADLLLDLPSHIVSHMYPSEKSPQKSSISTVVVRLNEIERILLIIGIGIQSSVWFLPSTTDLPTVGIVYFSTTNAGFLLVGGPILTFLQRCTTTFTTLRATILTLSSAIGFSMFAICNFVQEDKMVYHAINMCAMILTGLSGLLFIFLIAFCAFKYCCLKLRTRSDRQALLIWLTHPVGQRPSDSKGKSDQLADNDRELYMNYIPAVHMMSIFAIITSLLYVCFLPGHYESNAYETKNYVVIIAEIMVLVIELRIRKNEIARGLVCILNDCSLFDNLTSHY